MYLNYNIYIYIYIKLVICNNNSLPLYEFQICQKCGKQSEIKYAGVQDIFRRKLTYAAGLFYRVLGFILFNERFITIYFRSPRGNNVRCNIPHIWSKRTTVATDPLRFICTINI